MGCNWSNLAVTTKMSDKVVDKWGSYWQEADKRIQARLSSSGIPRRDDYRIWNTNMKHVWTAPWTQLALHSTASPWLCSFKMLGFILWLSMRSFLKGQCSRDAPGNTNHADLRRNRQSQRGMILDIGVDYDKNACYAKTSILRKTHGSSVQTSRGQ